jgi:hypothetical protein
LFLAAAAVALAGCARAESAAEAAFTADDAKCKSYGVEPATDAYVDCRLALDMQKGECGGRSSAAATVKSPWMRTFAFVHHDESTLLVVSAITLFAATLSDSAWVVPYSC